MLARTFEPERLPPMRSRHDIAKLVVAAKDEIGAAKLYAALVILNADAERLSVMRAEDKVTRDLVTLSSTIVRLMNNEPSRPYSGHKVDFHKVAKDIELRFSRANGFYRDNKYMLGL